MVSHNDASDEEWQGTEGGNGGGSRYPVHDACEFEDAEALRHLIFVPQSDESSVSSDNSTTTSSSTSSNPYKQQDATNPVVTGISPPGLTTAQAALLTQQAVNGETTTPPLCNGTSALNMDFHDESIGGVGSDEVPLKFKSGPESIYREDYSQPDTCTLSQYITKPEMVAALGSNNEMHVDNRNSQCERDITKFEKFKILSDPSEESVKQVSPETPAGKTDGSNQKHSQIKDSTEKKEKKKVKVSCPYDLDERDDDENTPLHIAIHARKIENVRILLEAGATVHKKCDGSAPIHLAISIGAIVVHAEFAKNCVDLLREYNADLTMRDDSFHTPLYLACVSNLCPVVEMLLNDPLSKETLNMRADRTGGRAWRCLRRTMP